MQRVQKKTEISHGLLTKKKNITWEFFYLSHFTKNNMS